MAEIDDPLVRFFPPEDEITLAELMRDTLVETPPVILPSHQMELSRRRMVALGLELIRATNLLLGREAPSAARSARAVLQA